MTFVERPLISRNDGVTVIYCHTVYKTYELIITAVFATSSSGNYEHKKLPDRCDDGAN